jgi:hypothetical protein
VFREVTEVYLCHASRITLIVDAITRHATYMEALMSTKSNSIKSVKQCGYESARNLDSAEKQAQFAIDNIAGFPAECPDESRAELNSGFLLRFHENNPPIEYGVVDGNYVPVSELSNRPAEVVSIGIDYAMSFTTHAFGRMGETHSPQLKAIVKGWRDRGSDYCSTCYKGLVNTAKRLLNKGKTRERGQTADFAVWLSKDWMDNGDTRCRNASKRGDPTADVVKFRMAKDAFLKVWAK